MKNSSPIFLIWLLFVASVLDLLLKLNLLQIAFLAYLEKIMLVMFIVCLILFWKTYNKLKNYIQVGIETWDDETKRDIQLFLQARGARLFTPLCILMLIALVLFVSPWFFITLPGWKYFLDVLFYVYLVGLFHVSLMSTLVFSKLIRTSFWVKNENHLADTEEI